MLCNTAMMQICQDVLQLLQRHVVIIFHLIQDADDIVDLLFHVAEQLTNVTTTETHAQACTNTHLHIGVYYLTILASTTFEITSMNV